jgi:hypothetical protein
VGSPDCAGVCRLPIVCAFSSGFALAKGFPTFPSGMLMSNQDQKLQALAGKQFDAVADRIEREAA